MGCTIKELTMSKSGESSRSASGRTGRRTFRVSYDADTPPANLAAVETADDGVTAIPFARTLYEDGDPWPGDSSRYCDRITVAVDDEAKDGRTFIVTADYNDALIVFEPRAEDPLEDPDEIDWGGAEAKEAYFYDRTPTTPKAVVNTAGQPFDDYRERENNTLAVTVKRNVAAFPHADAYTFKDTVNSASFTLDGATIAAGTAKIGVITCGPKLQRNGIEYRVATIPIKLNPNGWDDKVRSYGYAERVGGTGKPVPIMDAANNPVTKPWPLATNGAKKTNSTDVGDEIVFVPYEKVSFAALAFS